jgi:hypothetical protein
MKTTTIPVLAILLAMSALISAQNSVTVLNFEDEDETFEIIDHLHTEDWQTNPAYTRNTFALNPKKTGINTTERCATFSGYNSGNEWWYGFDIVLKTPISLTPELKYVHAMLMTNNSQVDTNRGLLLLNAEGGEVGQQFWGNFVTEEWVDFVFPIPDGAMVIGEFRFMFNHQADIITYLDEIVIDNNPEPRTGTSSIKNFKANNDFTAYPKDMSIMVITENENVNIEVYSLLGKLVYSQKASGNQVEIPVAEKGLYLVKGNQSTEKVLIK